MQSGLVAMEEVNAPPLIAKRNNSRVSPPKVPPYMSSFLLVGLMFSVITMSVIWWFGGQKIVPVRGHTIAPNCLGESLSLENWIRPRSSLMHRMTDSELFCRASFKPRISEYPFKRTPKIAFLFLTRGPLPMAPLWERFFRGQERYCSIYIHSLPNYQPDFSPSSVFYRWQIPSQVVKWGQMSLCDSERRLLANALLDISNERFLILSEACIPLRNFSVVYSYIMLSQYSFMGIVDDPSPQGRGRYNQSMSPLVNLTQWRKAPAWFEVNRILAVEIVEDRTLYPAFKDHCSALACFQGRTCKVNIPF